MKEAGLPEPEYIETPNTVRLILRNNIDERMAHRKNHLDESKNRSSNEFLNSAMSEFMSEFMSKSMSELERTRMQMILSYLDVNKEVPNLTLEDYQRLEKMSMDFAYDTFVDLREKQLQKNQESYNKYMYALKLRTEAADHIGIENIKKSRLLRLEREREEIERNFKAGKQVYPDFRLSLLVRLEA